MEKSCGDLPKVAIKKEVLSDDIKEFAENAMNELLGWYGYGSNSHREGSNSSGQESPKFNNEGCGWCGKSVDENTALSSAAATFCSELCFSQSRRANFKKNKTCDWCRHVRHTVSYADSQDGSSQLQFCSDKCLNQYKMHIFWRETRAHLEIHPHLNKGESTSSNLITPDLWMNKCKSPDTSASPSSPKLLETPQQTSPLPLITIAHPSKLMPNPHLETTTPEHHKKTRSKLQKKKTKKSQSGSPACTSTHRNQFPEMPQDLRMRHTPPNLENSRLLGPDLIPRSLPLPVNPRLLGSQYFDCSQEITNQRKMWESLVPPPTILVPYPIILPLPLPIPIPIPIPVSSNLARNEERFREVSSQTDEVFDSSQDNAEKVISRPLRKRKRVMEKKAKFVIKNKKVISI